MLYGIALATEGWGVVASLNIYPPFAGAAVSAITLVVAFGFAVSRPCLTLEAWHMISVSSFKYLLDHLSVCMLISFWKFFVSRCWKMLCISSARKLLFRQSLGLPLRCV